MNELDACFILHKAKTARSLALLVKAHHHLMHGTHHLEEFIELLFGGEE